MTTSTTAPTTHTVTTPDADVVFDVRGPLPPADGRPPLLMIGQPMDGSGFTALAGHFGDRTVVTYDPRGSGGRTTRKDGRTEVTPQDQAADVHAVIGEVGGPVDLLASSGSERFPSSWVGMPNWAGSGAGAARNSSVNSPGQEVYAMNAAIPAPQPRSR